jgi:hypothetical protein
MQGEIEQISLMEPKGVNGSQGLLEYLERTVLDIRNKAETAQELITLKSKIHDFENERAHLVDALKRL